jgi:HNH endonuclease
MKSSSRHVITEGLLRRFHARVDRRGGGGRCWNWTGYRNKAGYGVLFAIKEGKKSNVLAHRLALILSGVEIPEGKLACHTCDNPQRCNPRHLFVGTHADNTHDCIAKHRFQEGERHGNTHLTSGQVSAIRWMRANGAKLKVIASLFKVQESTVSRIYHRVRWKRS